MDKKRQSHTQSEKGRETRLRRRLHAHTQNNAISAISLLHEARDKELSSK